MHHWVSVLVLISRSLPPPPPPPKQTTHQPPKPQPPHPPPHLNHILQCTALSLVFCCQTIPSIVQPLCVTLILGSPLLPQTTSHLFQRNESLLASLTVHLLYYQSFQLSTSVTAPSCSDLLSRFFCARFRLTPPYRVSPRSIVMIVDIFIGNFCPIPSTNLFIPFGQNP